VVVHRQYSSAALSRIASAYEPVEIYAKAEWFNPAVPLKTGGAEYDPERRIVAELSRLVKSSWMPRVAHRYRIAMIAASVATKVKFVCVECQS